MPGPLTMLQTTVGELPAGMSLSVAVPVNCSVFGSVTVLWADMLIVSVPLPLVTGVVLPGSVHGTETELENTAMPSITAEASTYAIPGFPSR